jgi:RNA polymerase sigma-70 factor (ECF subfamily)
LSDDPEGAREVVQITLTRAVRKLDTFRAESALFTWLCAICRNEVSDWLRRQGRYRDHIVLVEDFPEVQAAVDSFQAPLEDSPERHYERVEAMRLIQVALDKLPAKYGNVLEWKYVEGHSVKEISAKLNIGTEATQSLLARAKRAFADVYSSMNKAINDDSNGLVQS